METILTLYEQRGQTWGIYVDGYGLTFANGLNNNRVFVYDYKRWACDAPEVLPKYIRHEMDKLVQQYGTRLNSLKNMLALNRRYRESIDYDNIVRGSEGNAVLRRFTEQSRNSPEGPLNAEVYISSKYWYIEALNVDDIFRVSCLRVEYKGKLYRAQYMGGCFSPYLVWSFIERKY